MVINILILHSGCELIRRLYGISSFGVTLPLITTASGQKLGCIGNLCSWIYKIYKPVFAGKSAGDAVWLDANMTSPFAWYQYFVQTDERLGEI